VKTSRTYFSQQFHDDLKLLFQAAGIGENKQEVVFLFDDTQVVEETFLEDINNILSTGEVRIESFAKDVWMGLYGLIHSILVFICVLDQSHGGHCANKNVLIYIFIY
jgi:hypothetical protein